MKELTIPLQMNSKTSLYEQIYQYIKEEIQEGKLIRGEELPSTRALSRHLEVSRATTLLAYEQLQSEGYIEASPGIGYFVSSIEAMGVVVSENIQSAVYKGRQPQRKYRYDFSPYGVDEKNFPTQIFKKLSKEVLSEEGSLLNKVGDARGEEPLRKAIANYLHRSRGVYCSPKQIIIGAGSDYLLLLLNTIMRKNMQAVPSIAFESPSYKKALQLFEVLSWDIYTVPMDDKGMDVERLRDLPVKMAYVMPSHQYPLGVVMPIQRRLELLNWAKEAESFILEDDYDSEFRYKGKPIPALQGYDKHDKVIYMGTFSKSIAPSLRVGYMVLPNRLLTQYEEIEGYMNCPVSRLDQLILLRFLEGGSFERHLNKTRTLYKNRHDMLLQSLKPLLPAVKISGEHAGVHILLHFPKCHREEDLIQKAKEKGIRVYGLSAYERNKSSQADTTILLGYANMSAERIVEAARILVEIWS